jgi:hypothetical protein
VFAIPEDNSYGGRNKGRFMDGNNKRERYVGQAQGSRGPLDGSCDEPMPHPHPMVGFNLPNQWPRPVDILLPAQAIDPPYFYYENVVLAPNGVLTTISRFLYDTQPQFVDSKYFCAAARKRGYTLNLLRTGHLTYLICHLRIGHLSSPYLQRQYPKHYLVPRGGGRHGTQDLFNCLHTCVSSAKLLEDSCSPYKQFRSTSSKSSEVCFGGV